ncbi:MAG: GNAT family N-acetyltransferase [Acidimicrobiales bacterium]
MTITIFVRRAAPGEFSRVIAVCGQALGWDGNRTDEAFFRWKHEQNPFGPSPIWVAVDTGEPGDPIVGVRAMMRWGLTAPDGTPWPVVRAVDTATLPAYQGQGIFRRLTGVAVDDLTAAGIRAVFNTPNDRSRPGYLKLGWRLVGRVPVLARVRVTLTGGPSTVAAMARSRVAAGRWGERTTAGVDPGDAFAPSGPLGRALRAARPARGWATSLGVDYLRWRTSFPALACRVVALGPSLEDGFIVFRVRQRGRLRQLSLLHTVLTPTSRGVRSTIGEVMAETGADLVLAAGSGPVASLLAAGLAPLPGAGPRLTWRPLASATVPDRRHLALDLGTIELF